MTVCPSNALSILPGTTEITINRSLCNECLACCDVCLPRALNVYGEKMTVSQVMTLICRDEMFYFHSSGGVTLSGGDVLCYPGFAVELLTACKESNIHTMAELSMFGDSERINMLMPYLDEYYVDIKLMNSESHKKWTGVDNRSILENIRAVSQKWPKLGLRARVPLVPEANDGKTNIFETASFCRDLKNCLELEFLPYHRLGVSTYQYLDRKTPFAKTPAMTFEEAHEKVAFLSEMNLPFPVKVAGRTIWERG